MSMLMRLKKEFGSEVDGFPEIKKQGESQYYIKFDNHSFMTSKNIPSREYLENALKTMLRKEFNPLQIQAVLVEKWGSNKKKGTHFKDFVSDGKYTGSMEYVKFKTNNTQNVTKSKVVCFVPWYGDIHLTPYDNTKYDPNKLNNTIAELFYKTKVLYVPKLEDRKYKHFNNHFFVQFVSLDKFEKIVRDNGLKFDIFRRKSYNQSGYLREELNESLRQNTGLKIENSKLEFENNRLKKELEEYKSKNDSLITQIDDITAEELELITHQKKRKRKSSKPNKKKGYHYLSGEYAKKQKRVPGFYKASFKNGKWHYSGNGIHCDDPLLILHVFRLDVANYKPKEILEKVPLFKGRDNPYAPLRNILLGYRNGEFEHAIRFIVKKYNLDKSFLNLIEFKKVPVLKQGV